MSTIPPSTTPPSTLPPEEQPEIRCARMWKRRFQEVVARAWTTDLSGAMTGIELDPTLCAAALYDESELVREVSGEGDGLGNWIVRFALPQVAPRPGHAYFLRINLYRASGAWLGRRDFFFGTT